MIRLTRFNWRHRKALGTVVATVALGLAAFCYALSLDEGAKRHIQKQLNELARMPGRLLT